MKKLISILLAATMLIGLLAACGSQSNTQTSGSGSNGTDISGSANEVKGPEGDLSSIIDNIYKEKAPGLAVGTVSVDVADAEKLKYYTGLDSADKIKEASVSEAMIGSQAYSLVLVRVNKSEDAEDVAKTMKEGIDQRKWICVEADDLRAVACGDVVMLMMVSSTFADTVTAEHMVDAFKTVCGGTLTVDLK